MGDGCLSQVGVLHLAAHGEPKTFFSQFVSAAFLHHRRQDFLQLDLQQQQHRVIIITQTLVKCFRSLQSSSAESFFVWKCQLLQTSGLFFIYTNRTDKTMKANC